MQLNKLQAAIPIWNEMQPVGGPKAFPLSLDFSSLTEYNIDLVNEQRVGRIDIVQSAWIDNIHAGGITTITIPGMGFHASIAAQRQLFMPLPFPQEIKFNVASTAGGTNHVHIILFNVSMPPLWIL